MKLHSTIGDSKYHARCTKREPQLVLYSTIRGRVGEYPVRALEEAVAEEKVKRGFSGFPHDPLVACNPQRLYLDWWEVSCRRGGYTRLARRPVHSVRH